jgi:Uma2 family endonuclease
MSSAAKILPHYTIAEWGNWTDQWELIEGIPHAMSPLPVPKHQIISGNLFSILKEALKACKHCKVYLPLDYKISDDTILQPDILIVCGEIKDKYLDFAPALVAEILSPSTALKDRHYKFDIYQQQGIPYYLIIDPSKNMLEIYLLEDDKYIFKTVSEPFTFSFDEECKIQVSFSELFYS